MDSLISIAQVISIIFVWMGILVLIAYLMSKVNAYFTQIESNEIKFIISGKTLVAILHAVKGMMLRVKTSSGWVMPTLETLDRAEFTPGEEGRTWLEKKGFYFYGFWPIVKVLKFEIPKDKENQHATKPEDWIMKKGTKLVDSLRYTFPRPFLHKEVELGDRTTVDFVTSNQIRVVNPYKPAVKLKGDFFANTSGILNGYVNKLTKDIADQEAYAKADKSEATGYLADLKKPDSDLNKSLLEQIGVVFDGISIPLYDPSDAQVRAAAQKAGIAELNKQAAKIDADAYALKMGIESEADRDRLFKLAAGHQKEIDAIVEPLERAKVSPEAIAKAVEAYLEKEMIKDAKLQTYVRGNSNVTPVIPISNIPTTPTT